MHLPHDKSFVRRPTPTGAYVSTCPHCLATAGFAFWEAELDQLEQQHACRKASTAAWPEPAARPAEPALVYPFGSQRCA
jgi:hypothetical protein